MTNEKDLPSCPECGADFTYEANDLFNCGGCGHEWNMIDKDAIIIRDSNGIPLQNGDTVTVIKDLKIKGSSSVVKVGTKVKNIRLVDGDHDIDCKVPGVGPMGLKSQFVKKSD